LDQGGHSSRAIVYDLVGNVVANAKYSLGVQRPQSFWVEQDGPEIVESMREVINDVQQQLGLRCQFIRSAGLATQRSNSMCWQKNTGKALSAAISWQDTRSYKSLYKYEPFAEVIREKTGLYITAHYGATKFLWCLQNLVAVQTALQQGNLAWGPLASYLVYSLTKEQDHLIDPANASRTLLWSLQQQNWDAQLLSCFQVPEAPLPQCVASKYHYGHLVLGQYEVALNVVTGDQSAAMFAFGKPRTKTLYINIGTGAFLQYSTGSERIQVPDLLSGIIYHDGDAPQFCVECTVNGAGSALSLVEEQLGMDKVFAEKSFNDWLQHESDNIPLFLNGVSGIGSPLWISDFESRFIGEGEDWQKIVAVAESILFLIMLNLSRLRAAKLEIKEIWVTGGLTVSDQLCQKLADLSGYVIYRPEVLEATARGTAWLASDRHENWCDDNSGFQFQPNRNKEISRRYQLWQQEMLAAVDQHKMENKE